MNYVLVPVPEELVPDVDQFLFQLRFRADVPVFDDEAISEHLMSLDEEPRELLLAVAEGVAAGQPYSDTELAERFGVSVRELFGLLTEVNDITVRPFSGNLVYAVRTPRQDDPSQTVRRLEMLKGYARAAVAQSTMVRLRVAARARREASAPADQA